MRNNMDVFEVDDATYEIVKKAVETRDLDRATQNLKDQADDTLNQNFNQFDFDNVMRERDTVVKSIQQTLSPKLSSLEDRHENLMDRLSDNDFQENLDDNAVDVDDWNNLMESYQLLRQIHSLTTVWAFTAHANSQDVAKAVDIQQMQADQNEAMKMVNKHFEKFESAADTIGRQVKQGQKEAVKEVLQEREDKIDDLERENKELKRKVEELENQGADIDDPNPLSPKQGELADLVKSNPKKDVEWLADQLGTPVNKVRQLESQIQDKGYSFSID